MIKRLLNFKISPQVQDVLLLFLGWLAAHRWYHNKPAIWNLLFIVTLGGFGLWYLVDLINILTYNF